MSFEVIDPDTRMVMDILPMTSNCNARELGELCGGCDECLYRQYSHTGYILRKLPDKDKTMPNVNASSVINPVHKKEMDDWGGYLFTVPELDVPLSEERLIKIYHQWGDVNIEKIKPSHMQVLLSVIEAYQLRDFLIENLDDLTFMMAESGCFEKKACKALAKFQKVYYEDHVKKLKDKIKELEEKLSKESSEVSE